MVDIDAIIDKLKIYNEAYRAGRPLVSDAEYDQLVENLKEMVPDHPFLNVVEPETFAGKQRIPHPVPMLSTDKAYTETDLRRFVNRVQKAAEEIGAPAPVFRVTAKLDGLAGRDDGQRLVSRGNGLAGFDISGAFEKGVIAIDGRGRGLGEIVMRQSYFEAHLADDFEHPRNLVVGIVSSEQVSELAGKALQAGAVHFVPYASLPAWRGSGEDLIDGTVDIAKTVFDDIDYPVDGMVAEVVDDAVKQHMGATAHHYRWQIAIKSRGKTAMTRVESITWQVGRTGNITPVLEVAPVRLSGATIRRVTAHNAGVVEKASIGPGAEIEIIRSGEVIPKLERVVTAAEKFSLPILCPSCKTPLERQNDFLRCTNREHCTDQVVQRLRYWFNTLGTADWFGIRTVQKIVEAGYDRLEDIYQLDREAFLEIGFGPVQSDNLAEAIRLSRSEPVEDWRFLAAFGIPNLGVGDSRKLLRHFRIDDIPELGVADIEAIHGFGRITAEAIVEGMKNVGDTIRHMMALAFNLEKTPLDREQADALLPFSGKRMVFTGKMRYGSRDDMEALARRQGAQVQKAISGNTDFLVCGEKVGPKKMEKARREGVTIIDEDAFFKRLSGD